MGEGDLARGKAFITEHFPLIRANDESPTLDWLFDKMRATVRRYGVRIVVADPYNELEHRRPEGMTETEYVSDMLGRMRRFADVHECQVILVADVIDAKADCKDANDVLVKHGAEKVRECIEAAKPYPVTGVYTFEQFGDDIDRLYRDGVE